LVPIAQGFQKVSTVYPFKFLDYEKDALVQKELEKMRKNRDTSESITSSRKYNLGENAKRSDKNTSSVYDLATSQG
jgi:uncharacterized membrane protein YvbJ